MAFDEVDRIVAEIKSKRIDPDVVAEWLDGLIDWNSTIPSPVGDAIETLDGPAAKALIEAARRAVKRLWLLKRSPEDRAAAKARREHRREKRGRKRTEEAT